MASIQAAVRAMLLADVTVKASFGYDGTKLRFWPGKLYPGATLPAMVYQVIDRTGDRSHSRTESAPEHRLQIKVWAATYDDAHDQAREVQRALEGYKGVIAGVTISDVKLANELDQDDEQTGNQAVVQDYLIKHEE